MTLAPISETSTTKATRTDVLAVGNWTTKEFAAARQQTDHSQEWRFAADIRAAHEKLNNCDVPPELILLAQPLPGAYSQDDINRLQQSSPLTRLVIVAGTWCEGEWRTGTPPAGVVRLYWYELAPWWQAAVRRRDAGLCPLWSLPLDQPHAARMASNADLAAAELSVLVDTTDFAVYDTLRDGLKRHGLDCFWHRYADHTVPAPSAEVGIWDGSQLDRTELGQLADFCPLVAGPVVVLLDFPRIEHLAQARQAGASKVLAKPYVVEELVAALTIRQAA